MHMLHNLRKIQERRLAARTANAIRWQRDRERRAALAAAAPRGEWRIVERLVCIRHETSAREIVRYAHETERDWRRKLCTMNLRPK